MSQRLLWVDALRAFAIILMVIFHFCYDLRYFGYVDWNIPNGSNWWPFRYLILSLFIFTVGLSLHLSHSTHFRVRGFITRLSQLGIAAMAITVMSVFLFPKAWIYFGILHFIALASLLSLPLIRKPLWALIIGAVILAAYYLGLLSNDWPFNYFSRWLPQDTEDYVPLFPWLGVMYLGVGFGGLILPRMTVKEGNKKIKASKRTKSTLFDIPNNKTTVRMATLGRHGLLIYLIHQPVLFAGFYLIQYLHR